MQPPEEFRTVQNFRTTQFLKQAAISDTTNTDKTTRNANLVEKRNDDCINLRNKVCISRAPITIPYGQPRLIRLSLMTFGMVFCLCSLLRASQRQHLLPRFLKQPPITAGAWSNW
jgi:hypothetical protein